MSADRVKEIRLKEHDVVVEMSGGSKDQPTGRAAIITADLLDYFGMPVVCSNFCKALRLKTDDVDPYWFYFYWKKCYDDGVTTRYENQPSGIKNFQLDEFLEAELILLPPIQIQTAIIEKLKRMSNLKNKMAGQVQNISNIIENSFENYYFDFEQ